MSHTATLTWGAPSDAIPTSAYNIYRATGTCPASGLGSLVFSKIDSAPITSLTYTDSTVTVGNSYCYYATQVQNGTESVPGVTSGGTVRPGTVVTIQLVLT